MHLYLAQFFFYFLRLRDDLVAEASGNKIVFLRVGPGGIDAEGKARNHNGDVTSLDWHPNQTSLIASA